GGEGFVLRIIHQEIPVSEVKYPWLARHSLSASTGERAGVRCRVLVPFRGPEFPADLEGDHGLAGTGGHSDQDAALAAENRLDDAINGNALVVVRYLSGAEV